MDRGEGLPVLRGSRSEKSKKHNFSKSKTRGIDSKNYFFPTTLTASAISCTSAQISGVSDELKLLSKGMSR